MLYTKKTLKKTLVVYKTLFLPLNSIYVQLHFEKTNKQAAIKFGHLTKTLLIVSLLLPENKAATHTPYKATINIEVSYQAEKCEAWVP